MAGIWKARMVMGETMTKNNDKEILDLITASVEAMGMNPNHATIKVEHRVSDIPSELELRIRNKVLKNVETLLDGLYNDGLTDEYQIELITDIKHYLNLLWCEK